MSWFVSPSATRPRTSSSRSLSSPSGVSNASGGSVARPLRSFRNIVEAHAGGLEGGIARCEQIDRVLERAPCSVVVAPGRRQRPFRGAHRGTERACPRPRRDLAKLRQRLGGTPVLSEACERLDGHLEPCAALDPARVREPPEIAIGQLFGLCRLAAVEGERGAPEQGERVRLAAGEELLRIGQPALPPAQLAQARERVANHRRPGRLQPLDGRTELALRLVPSPLPAEHARVVRPAGVEQEDVVLTAELAHAGAPLGRPLVVAHPLARRDQVAAGPRDAVQEPRLPAERHRRRLVEATHAFLELPVAHERPPLEAPARASRAREPRTSGRARRRAPPAAAPCPCPRPAQPRYVPRGWRASRDRPPARDRRRGCARDGASRWRPPARHGTGGSRGRARRLRAPSEPLSPRSMYMRKARSRTSIVSRSSFSMWAAHPSPSSASGVAPSARDSAKQALARSQSPPPRAAQPASRGAVRISSSATSARRGSGPTTSRREATRTRAVHGHTLTSTSDDRQARRQAGPPLRSPCSRQRPDDSPSSSS